MIEIAQVPEISLVIEHQGMAGSRLRLQRDGAIPW
jgi:hypothetical protein